ncbi:hypothetical protein J7K27_00465 [Candidatus Bathyarchaeota archaeon]|nr:hypothetical protein [Candidatus Bathyarchaeota archaeon]
MADKWIEVNIHLNDYSRTNEALIKNRKNSPKLQERKLDIVCIIVEMPTYDEKPRKTRS